MMFSGEDTSIKYQCIHPEAQTEPITDPEKAINIPEKEITSDIENPDQNKNEKKGLADVDETVESEANKQEKDGHTVGEDIVKGDQEQIGNEYQTDRKEFDESNSEGSQQLNQMYEEDQDLIYQKKIEKESQAVEVELIKTESEDSESDKDDVRKELGETDSNDNEKTSVSAEERPSGNDPEEMESDIQFDGEESVKSNTRENESEKTNVSADERPNGNDPEEIESDIQFDREESVKSSTRENESEISVDGEESGKFANKEDESGDISLKKEPIAPEQSSNSNHSDIDSTTIDGDSRGEQFTDASGTKKTYPKNFTVTLSSEEFDKIRPVPSGHKKNYAKLRKGWTHMFARKFNKVNPSCVLKFNYHKVQEERSSSNRQTCYIFAKAKCKHKNCGIWTMRVANKPKRNRPVEIMVTQVKAITKHKKGVSKKRHLSGHLRKDAQEKTKTESASSVYWTEYKKMPEEELDADNMTNCQSEDVLRKAKSELKTGDILHPEPFTELVLLSKVF